MDNEELEILLDTIEEIRLTLDNIRYNPIMVTQEDLDILEYNLNYINEYSKMIKRRVE